MTARNAQENRDYWQEQHRAAVVSPSGFERPVLGMLVALRQYARQHRLRYASPLSEDGYTGEAWMMVAKGLRRLLSCETGRLDCATIDGKLVEMVRAAGFKDSEL